MQEEVLAMLSETGAIITNSHIVLTSGRHADAYINKDALYPHTKFSSRIGELFAEKHKDMDIDIVAAPALGGIVLSQWTAYHLSKQKKKEVLSVYAEKTPDKNLIFTRGYDNLIKGKKLLVVEDITATGDSVKKVIKSVLDTGGKVTAVSVMVNREPQINTKTIGFPFSALAAMQIQSFNPEECELCKKNIPINITVGHGRKYLAEKQKQ